MCRGESIWRTFLFYHGLTEFITLAGRLDRTADVARFEEYRRESKARGDEFAWDGRWFLRGYLDDGTKLGTHQSEVGRIFLNAQTWAVISGGIAEGEKGRQAIAHHSWLTGTASWGFVAVTQYILGVRADYDGLVVEPCIPSSWEEYEVRRVFRGATYHIKVRNPEHVSTGVRRITVDGWPITGKVLPVAPEGSTVAVEVVMGRGEEGTHPVISSLPPSS
ncbi:MAG: GH36-type glycosyl hydrolase domain-containing protein [Bacillota bacterium]